MHHQLTQIFLLDDDPVVLQGAAEALGSLGEVSTSSLWSELAGALLRQAATDGQSVLVCDLDMPGINGGDFCTIVRRHSPRTRIVIFTSAPERAPVGVADLVVSKRGGVGALREAVAALLK